MILKCGPAGNLFPYLEDERDARGRDREQTPVPLLGDIKRAMRLLVEQAPAVAVPELQGPLWVQHCRQQLTHFINGFSEDQKIVEANLPAVIQGTEALILAGLPRDALHFVWYEHPQRRGTHTHCGVVRSLLPRGGYYTPQLSLGLAQLFSRLVSRRLGLSDPLEPAEVRLIRSPYGVAKAETARVVDMVTAEVRTWLGDGRLQSHTFLLALLEQLGLEILFHPDETGTPQARAAGKAAGKPGRGYPNTVTVRTPAGHLIYFTGPVCRPDFSSLDWEIAMGLRKQDVVNLQAHPQLYYAYFVEELSRRIKAQQNDYPLEERGRIRITLRDFEWLNPASPLWRCPLAELYAGQPATTASPVEMAGPALGFARLPAHDRSYDAAAADPKIREFGHAFYDDFDPDLKDITAPDEFEDEAEEVAAESLSDAPPPVPTPPSPSLNPPGEAPIIPEKPQPSRSSTAADGERPAGLSNPLPPIPVGAPAKPTIEVSGSSTRVASQEESPKIETKEAPAGPAKILEAPAPAAVAGESPPPAASAPVEALPTSPPRGAGAEPNLESVRDDKGEVSGAALPPPDEGNKPPIQSENPAGISVSGGEGEARASTPDQGMTEAKVLSASPDLAEDSLKSAAEIAPPVASAASEPVATTHGPIIESATTADPEVQSVPESGEASPPSIPPVIAAREKAGGTTLTLENRFVPLALQLCLQVAQWHEILRDSSTEIRSSSEAAETEQILAQQETGSRAPNQPKTATGRKFSPAFMQGVEELHRINLEKTETGFRAPLKADEPVKSPPEPLIVSPPPQGQSPKPEDDIE